MHKFYKKNASHIYLVWYKSMITVSYAKTVFTFWGDSPSVQGPNGTLYKSCVDQTNPPKVAMTYIFWSGIKLTLTWAMLWKVWKNWEVRFFGFYCNFFTKYFWKNMKLLKKPVLQNFLCHSKFCSCRTMWKLILLIWFVYPIILRVHILC